MVQAVLESRCQTQTAMYSNLRVAAVTMRCNCSRLPIRIQKLPGDNGKSGEGGVGGSSDGNTHCSNVVSGQQWLGSNQDVG